MGRRCWELIAADEPTVVAKPFLDAIVVGDGQSNRRLPDPTRTDKSDGYGPIDEARNLFNQLFMPK